MRYRLGHHCHFNHSTEQLAMYFLSILKRQSIIFMMLTISLNCYSADLVKLRKQKLFENKSAHNFEVIQRALEVTSPEYGPFIFEEVPLHNNSARMLKSTVEGEVINIALMPANEEWDRDAIPIRIPIRLGLLNYRLLLVNKTELATFQRLNNYEQLSGLSVGLKKNWITAKVYQASELAVVGTTSFPGLFLMLEKYRFDYIPRTIYEIYDDVEHRHLLEKGIDIEPTVALHIPMYTYLYVSPKFPRLAKRFEEGLNKLMLSGELKTLLFKYYGTYIKQANLDNRKIIYIENKFYQDTNNINKKYLFNAN